MPHRVIDRIRRTILLGDYDLTIHAVEEMAEDYLDVFDGELGFASRSDAALGSGQYHLR